MGNENSGTSRKPRRLPRAYRDGWLERADGRVGEVRRVREATLQILEDRGGEDTQSLLARRTAARCMFIDLLLARDEQAFSAGQPIDQNAYLGAATVWLRYVAQLGLARRARPARTLQELMSEPVRATQEARSTSTSVFASARSDRASDDDTQAPESSGGDSSG